MKLSSVVLRFRPPPVPSPATIIAVDAALGWIVKFVVPLMLALIAKASALIVRSCAPIVIAAPTTTLDAVNDVAPN